jgi:hypothetical protein
VAKVFHTTGSGAIRINVVEGVIGAMSRTYNLGQDGTYGQGIPAVADVRALDSSRVVRLGLLGQSASESSGRRSNLIFVNLGDDPLRLEVRVVDLDGTAVAVLRPTLGPEEQRQLNSPLAGLGAEAVVATVRALDPAARYLVAASVVDNSTGDPVYVTPY